MDYIAVQIIACGTKNKKEAIKIHTRLYHVTAKYKILIEQDISLSNVLLYLNREGLSITESIKIVRTLYKLPLSEAKQIVSNHEAWKATVRDHEPFHEELANIINNI